MSVVEADIHGTSADDTALAAAASGRQRRRLDLGAVTGLLTMANASVALVGVVTGPLQARALGPAGRGELAAILTPFAFLPTLAGVGLGSYVQRAVARGRHAGAAFGAILPVIVGVGLALAVLAPPIAGLLAGGRAVVYTMLIVGLVLFPIGMVTNVLLDVSIGLEDWRPVMTYRVIPPIVQLVCIPALFFSGNLTVSSAAIVSFGGSVILLLPASRAWRRCRPLQFDFRELREATAFGAKCWFGGLSNLANARLDQLLMIRLVSSSVLGVYAVAVTLATFFLSPVVAAISTAAGPRMARGDGDLSRQLCRLTLAGAAVVGLGVGVLSPFVLRYVFGPAFMGALPMALILLVGTVPNGAGGVLNTSVSAHGRPDLAARGEGLALIVTVGGLAVALPTLGGIGAALVSTVAYSTQFLFLLTRARRLHGGRYRDYVLITSNDARLVRLLLSGKTSRLRNRLVSTLPPWHRSN